MTLVDAEVSGSLKVVELMLFAVAELAETLTAEGDRVHSAAGGVAGLELECSSEVDLVVLDG